MNTTHFKSALTPGTKVAVVIVIAGLVSGCASNGAFSNMDGLNWFNSSEPGETLVLARDPASLAGGTQVERTIHDAVELARQKRFFEARRLLADVRAIQDRQSEGYQAISCAMALLGLRQGDIGAFGRIARQLDAALGNPVRVDNAYVDVISLHRAMNNRNLPVNASEPMKALKERLFATESARL